MKNSLVVLASISQLIAVVLFIGVIKGIGGLMSGTVDLPIFILIICLAFIFQGLSYSLAKRHPEEHAKATKIMHQPNKNYGLFALLFFIVAMGMLLTFMLNQGVKRIALQIIIILVGVACSFWIFRRK